MHSARARVCVPHLTGQLQDALIYASMQFHDDLSEAQCDRVHHLGHQMNEYVVDLISFVQRMRTCIEQSIRTLSPEETPSRLTTTLERLFAQLDGMVDTCETVKTNNKGQ